MGERNPARAANEVVFRNINEWVEELTTGRVLDVVCECDDMNCGKQFPVSVETYERVRSEGTLFLVLPGHDDESIEEVVERADRYVVVRKDPGRPANVARATDPRAG
jgi:hypothetical protein